MPRFLRYSLIALAVPVTLALMVGVVFAVDRSTNGGEILGGVTVNGVDLSGLGEDDALQALRLLEDELQSTPIALSIDGSAFTVLPSDFGLEIDERAILDEAMAMGRAGEGTLVDQFTWWVDHIGDDEPTELEIPHSWSEDRLHSILSEIQAGLDRPPTSGDVRIEGTQVVYQYPEPGTGFEIQPAAEAVRASLLQRSRNVIDLPTITIEPAVSASDIDSVVREVSLLISDDVSFRDDIRGKRVTVPRDVVAESIDVRLDQTGSEPEFRISYRGTPVIEHFRRFHPYLATEPHDASIEIDVETDEVTIVPSTPVLEADTTELPRLLWRAANSITRSAEIPYRVDREAEFSTADAEAMGVRELIGEFTTFHRCCESRVINIQLIADATDGAVVAPGETWSLNDHVGQRTREKGYVAAGAIIGGEVKCCDDPINIGGGTSQFTTTLYNAFFFAGLEDVEHQPHTIYFTRYPEGREATLGFPTPDLVFRNNTENTVIIRTTHTDTSITAKIYGDNGGIEVEAGLSNRYDFSGIRETVRTEPDTPFCVEVEVQAGSGGWAVDITRFITYPDGTTTEEVWTWRYTGAHHILEVHPTRGPGSDFCENGGDDPDDEG